MNDFLKHQYVKNEERRRKVVRKMLLRVQQISLVVLVWSIFLGGIYGLYQLVFVRSIFVVKNVEIDGNLQHISDAEVRELAGIKTGANLFSVDLSKVQKQISEAPWVKEVAVARKFPSTVWIYVGEYQPFAALSKDGLYLVDQGGNVFKEVEGRDEKNLPVITGTSSEEELNGSLDVLRRYMGSPMNDYFTLSEVHYDGLYGYSIVISSDGLVIKVGFDNIDEKFERLYSMLSAISSYGPKMRYVDLNIPGKVVVKYES